MLLAELSELEQRIAEKVGGNSALNTVVSVALVAVLTVVFWYLKGRDKKETDAHKQCESTIIAVQHTVMTVVAEHREAVKLLTKGFEDQLEKEREYRQKDNDEWRKNNREMAAIFKAAK